MAKKHLVIVESPAKAKTIGKYLGKDYEVKASMGHLRDLPKSKLGVDIETTSSLSISPSAEKRSSSASSKRPPRAATPCILQRTRTARAKPSRGT